MRRAYSDGRARYSIAGLLVSGLIAAMLLTLLLAPRPASLVPNPLASLSEQDQVEWLINRILERSGRNEGFKVWLSSLIPIFDKKYPLNVCFETLAEAAAFADRPALIQRLYRLARTEREREFIRFGEARLLLKRGEVDSALRLAEKLSERRGEMLCRIALAPATPAEQLVQRLPEPARSKALYQLAMQYARADEITSALQVYRQATPTRSRAISDLKQNASLKIAIAYATQGKLREALAVLDPVAPPSQDPYSYAETICTLHQNEYHQQAREVLQRMCTHIQQKDPSWSDPTTWWVPVKMLSAGQTRPLARELVQWLDGELRRIGDSDILTLSDLAALCGFAGDLPRAVECAARIRQRHHQAQILHRALDAYIEQQIFWENLDVVLKKP